MPKKLLRQNGRADARYWFLIFRVIISDTHFAPDLKVIQSIMGHANIETTMDIYAEATDVKKKEAIKALENNSDIF